MQTCLCIEWPDEVSGDLCSATSALPCLVSTTGDLLVVGSLFPSRSVWSAVGTPRDRSAVLFGRNTSQVRPVTKLHKMMLQTKIAHWGILPLENVTDPWLASVREQHWWFVFSKYACNDVVSSISTDGQGSQPRGWLNQRVLAVLQGLREAK